MIPSTVQLFEIQYVALSWTASSSLGGGNLRTVLVQCAREYIRACHNMG